MACVQRVWLKSYLLAALVTTAVLSVCASLLIGMGGSGGGR